MTLPVLMPEVLPPRDPRRPVDAGGGRPAEAADSHVSGGGGRCAGCSGNCCGSRSTAGHHAKDDDAGGVPPLLSPQQRVLATLNADGGRRWLKPRLTPGKWWRRRQIVAYVLLAVLLLTPWIPINGHPALLLDVPARRFHILGFTFLPTDTILLALLMLGVGLLIFFATAVFGRLWCGWACPQTVWMEFVFRPIERLVEGTAGRGGKAKRKNVAAIKFALFAIVAFIAGNTFLAYFVGVDRLLTWMTGPPTDHLAGFLLVLGVTAAMLFDFGYFREQLCHIACPYGRFQSVMLDRDSLVVSYDEPRGEPRRRAGARDEGIKRLRDQVTKHVKGPASPALGPSVPRSLDPFRQGDCVDCTMCVQVCPMGIDIRDGLQMECIHCTQCMDACDDVMAKLNRPLGLVGYASGRSREEGGPWLKLRPRLMIYPIAILTVSVLFLVILNGRTSINLTVLRSLGQPFAVTEDGGIRNTLRLKVVNRTGEPQAYEVSLTDPRLTLIERQPLTLEPGGTATHAVAVVAEPAMFTNGRLRAQVRVEDGSGNAAEGGVQLLAPATEATR
jgi:polyferredoxin